jgi:hypothetical protein
MENFKCIKEDSFLHLREDIKEVKDDVKEMRSDLKELLAEKNKQRGIIVAMSSLFTFIGFIVSLFFGSKT